MSLPMTKIEGAPGKEDLLPGMAHFARTGPFATTCGECKHRGYYRKDQTGNQYKVQSCAMYRQMAGRHGPDVKASYPSCKYFERIEVKK